jgi:mannose-6-phosphate isomerase-like protein (cupin superfamily)
MKAKAFFTTIDDAPTVALRGGRGYQTRLVGPETAAAQLMDIHINVINVESEAGPLHYHERAENAYIVLEGNLEITVEGVSQVVGPNGVAWIPPGLEHSVGNVGDAPARLIEIYAPAGEDFHIVTGDRSGSR